MDFSDVWRRPWPIGGVIAAPSLLSSSNTQTPSLGPLLFHPSSPPVVLISSPTLAVPLTVPLPPTVFRDSLQAYLTGGIRDAFFPISLQDQLVSELLSSEPTEDPSAGNNLSSIRCFDGARYIFFFPTGENANRVGFFGVSLSGGRSELVLNSDGDVFEQRHGYRYDSQRIQKIAVREFDNYTELPESSAVDGYVLATTMYSVNWFRVESTFFDKRCSQKMPVLVPVAKQGFRSCVTCACWNPHFVEESVVLLETGELIWIDVKKKRGRKIEVLCGGDFDGCHWKECEFGVHPWAVFVSGSMAVVLVDLRPKVGEKPSVLAKAGYSDTYSLISSMKDDTFTVFCVAEFDRFYFSVVTEHHLLLYDMREPLYPLLVWDHGISNPCYVTMIRLSDLRAPIELSKASGDGYAILVGSFWKSKFKIFCYGPDVREGSLISSSFYAWELPSSFALSGRGYGAADCIFNEEELFSSNLPHGAQDEQHLLKKDLVLGFCILPRDHVFFKSDSNEMGDFDLIRLMSSGKVELQRYSAASDHCEKSPFHEGKPSSEFHISSSVTWEQDELMNDNLIFLKFDFLLAYLNGCLSETLYKMLDNPEARPKDVRVECNLDLWELIKSKISSVSLSVSDAIKDVTFPTSIHELACRRVLGSLSPTLLYLAFSAYPELFGGYNVFSLEFFEIPGLSSSKHLLPFLMGKPSSRGEKWSCNRPRGASVVGPVLPIPVLHTLDQLCNEEVVDDLEEEADGGLLSKQCSLIRQETITSLSGSADLDELEYPQKLQNENPFFVYEYMGHTVNKEPYAKERRVRHLPMDYDTSFLSSDPTVDEKNHTTFICGNHGCDDDLKNIEQSDMNMFDDLMHVRLDFESSELTYSTKERKVYKRLSRQFLRWQEDFKPYRDFCTSSKVPKENL